MTKKKSLTIRDEALKIVCSSENALALKEICSFQNALALGYVTIFFAVLVIPIIGLTFGVDKLFKVNIKTDAYNGAIALAASLALIGESLALVDRRAKQLIERQTFYNLRIAQLPEVSFEYCYFEDCTFEVDLSTERLKGCIFFRCRFSSRIGRSVEGCSFRGCNFSGATIDPGFFLRHDTHGCDFSKAKAGEIYPRCKINTDYPPQGWIGYLSCDHNARSPHLRCAINPVGPCDGCSDFTHSPVSMDVQHVEV